MRRQILTSRDTYDLMKSRKQKVLEVNSFFPIDRHDCACYPEVVKLRLQIAQIQPEKRTDFLQNMGRFTCPRDKSKMIKKIITCRNCGQAQGSVWATDDKLTDWCDFHYYQWTDGNEWNGCLTPNVSIIDGHLGLECCCGYDTRDFRGNMSLSTRIAEDVEKSNAVGRRFGEPDSKFAIKNAPKGVK